MSIGLKGQAVCRLLESSPRIELTGLNVYRLGKLKEIGNWSIALVVTVVLKIWNRCIIAADAIITIVSANAINT